MRIKNLGHIFTRVGPLVDYLFCGLTKEVSKKNRLFSHRVRRRYSIVCLLRASDHGEMKWVKGFRTHFREAFMEPKIGDRELCTVMNK